MKWMLVATGAVLLSACIEMASLVIYNNTGVEIVTPVFRDKRHGVDTYRQVHIAAGETKKVRALFSGVMSVTAGTCTYHYEAPSKGYEAVGRKRYAVQVDPNMTVHLLSWGYGEFTPGQFADADLEGFPLRPQSRDCE